MKPSEIAEVLPARELGAVSYQTVSASQLRIGSRLNFPIHDSQGILLLGQGQTVTVSFLRHLQSRSIVNIRVHASEVANVCAGSPQGTAKRVRDHREGVFCPVRNETTERLDDEVLKGDPALPPQGEAFARQLQRPGLVPYSGKLKDEVVERRCAEVNQIGGMFTGLLEGRGLDVECLTSVTESVLSDLVRDPDLLASVGANPFFNPYPDRHSLHFSMVAMLLGTALKLDRTSLEELSIGCLLHDSGMLKIERSAFTTRKPLTADEFAEITKHPIALFEMAKNIEGIPLRSALVAYQVHERCNGTGYPRRQTGAKIHFLSKIAAVADAYVGLVSPRPHRRALMPYFAMVTMLQGVRQGLYDAGVVRALLDTLSLFPLGSYVRLSDGSIGRVIRPNPDAYTRPLLEVWSGDDLGATPAIVDLIDTEVEVASPLPSLKPAA